MPTWVCAMDHEVAEAVLERAAGHCEACGWPGSELILHHRKLRSQGGEDTVDNLLGVHPSCHGQIHLHPEHAEFRGWIVKGGADPAQVAVQLGQLTRGRRSPGPGPPGRTSRRRR